jgi:hypothetical protein
VSHQVNFLVVNGLKSFGGSLRRVCRWTTEMAYDSISQARQNPKIFLISA